MSDRCRNCSHRRDEHTIDGTCDATVRIGMAEAAGDDGYTIAVTGAERCDCTGYRS